MDRVDTVALIALVVLNLVVASIWPGLATICAPYSLGLAICGAALNCLRRG